MPIVDVIYGPSVSEDRLRILSSSLPHAVSVAVECPEEPYECALKPGDVDVRFHPRGPFDAGGLDVLVHIHSKWFESRAVNKDARCDRLRDALVEDLGDLSVGVYLALPVAAWSQTP